MEEDFIQISDINNSEHYSWGNHCEGWHFLKSGSLSIIKESMPGMAKEKLHYHKKAQQFFYILSGTATFDINGQIYNLVSNQGIYVKPGSKHRVFNNAKSNLEFLLISEPFAQGDRVEI